MVHGFGLLCLTCLQISAPRSWNIQAAVHVDSTAYADMKMKDQVASVHMGTAILIQMMCWRMQTGLSFTKLWRCLTRIRILLFSRDAEHRPYSEYDHFQPVTEDWCRQSCLSDCLCVLPISRKTSAGRRDFCFQTGWFTLVLVENLWSKWGKTILL